MKFSKMIVVITMFGLFVCAFTGCYQETSKKGYLQDTGSDDKAITSDLTDKETSSGNVGGNDDKNEPSNVESIKYSMGLTFELDIETDTYIVKELGTCTDKIIMIPPVFDGKAVTVIDEHCFNTSEIQEVIIPEGVHTIRDRAFKGCSRLKEIKLPSTISDIGFEAFTNCESLENINLSGTNDTYKTIDGVLYSNSGKTLKHYPAGRNNKTFTVPDGVEIIGYYAFDGCTYLEDIILPDSIVKLNNAAFAECFNLVRVVIPRNIKQISWEVFYDCKNLVIEYEGTTNEWISLNKDSEWNNGAQISQIICSNGILP